MLDSTRFLILRRFLILITALFALGLGSLAQANDHGGGGAGPVVMKFTTNLGGPFSGRYLQIEVMMETAAPETSPIVEAYRPRIQHEIILMLSDEDENTLRTLHGKEALQEKILNLVNHVIHADEKDGIKEVLFTNFIIQ